MGTDHPDDSGTRGGDLVGGRTSALRSLRTSYYAGHRVLIISERGNAPAEFVLVSALLVSLVLGLLQVLFVGYARHALTAAASEGARQASLPDVSGEQALALTRALITESLSDSYATDVVLEGSTRLGVLTTEVIITAPIPVLGIWTTRGTLQVSAHAPREVPQ